MSFLSLLSGEVKKVVNSDQDDLCPIETTIVNRNFFPEKNGKSRPVFDSSEYDAIKSAINEFSLDKLLYAVEGDAATVGIRLFEIFKDILLISSNSPTISILSKVVQLNPSFVGVEEFDDIITALKELHHKYQSNPNIKYLKLSIVSSHMSYSDYDLAIHFHVTNNSGICMPVVIAFIPCRQDAKLLTRKKINDYDVFGSSRNGNVVNAMYYQHADHRYFACLYDTDSANMLFTNRPNALTLSTDVSCDTNDVDSAGFKYTADNATCETGMIGSYLSICVGLNAQEITEPVMWKHVEQYEQLISEFRLEDLLTFARNSNGMNSFIFGLMLNTLRACTGPYGMSIVLRDKYVFDVSGYRHFGHHITETINGFKTLADEVINYSKNHIGFLKIDTVGEDFSCRVTPDFYMFKHLYVNDRYPAGNSCVGKIIYIPCKNDAKWIISGVYPLSIARTDCNDDYPERMMKAACYEHMDGTIFAVCTYKNFKGQSTIFIEKDKKIIDVLLNRNY